MPGRVAELREMADSIRSVGSTMSLTRDRELLLKHALQLEGEADFLEAAYDEPPQAHETP